VGGEPVELLDAVMHRVELPKPRHRVEGAVHQVESGIRDHQNLGELQPPGLRRDGLLPGWRDQRPGRHHAEDHHRQGAGPDEPAVDRDVDEVVPPALPEQLLRGMERDEALERHEDHQEEQKALPVEQVHRGLPGPARGAADVSMAAVGKGLNPAGRAGAGFVLRVRNNVRSGETRQT
jgi:hypothetical protein